MKTQLFRAVVCTAMLFCFRAHAAGVSQHSLSASHDTYVQPGTNSNFGSGTTMVVKRNLATSSSGTDRLSYLGFDAASTFPTALDASLTVTITSYPGDGSTPFTFELYGLPDGHPNEGFDESLLNFSNATNASTSHPGSLNPAGLTLLATATAPVATGQCQLTFGGDALANFVAASTNTRWSFVILRQSVSASTPTYIATSENSLTLRPALVVRTPNSAYDPVATTASSTASGSSPNLASDDQFSTRWTANPDTSSTKSSLTLDLGSPQPVNCLQFTPYQFGRAFKLECSDNQSSWTTLISRFVPGSGSGVNTYLETTTRFFPSRSARYFRVSSLTSTTGNSLSVWEMQLLQDSVAQVPFDRLASLTSQVAALPNTTPAEQLKRVVLEVAIERANASLQAGVFSHGSRMMDDAENHLAADATTMATPATGVPNLRVLSPLRETTTATNPYLKRIADGAALYLATSDAAWEKNTISYNVLADFNAARDAGEKMDTLFWVFAHPDSPLRHHPEILRRLLRRAHGYLDSIILHGPQLSAGQLASFYDDFAIAPASIVFREFQALYPGLITTQAAADWNQGMTIAADNLWSAYRNRTASWVNTDVAIAVELFNFGTKTNRPELLEKAKYFIDDVLTSGRMFEDGAVGYIGTQNEAGGYQSTVASYVNRYYQMTGYAPALEILQKMEWYGPINGPMIDWWTSPSWKHAWNFISGSNQTGEATNGKNPYVRAEMDASINAPATSSNWFGQQANVAWYERGTVAATRPDGPCFDRNIQGPRAWHGLWNYTGTLRNIGDSESGHHTLMGCQVMETTPSFRVNAAVMGVFPRIRISSGTSRDTDGGFNEARHAWLTSKLSGASTVTSHFSSLAASYRPHVFGSSTKGAEHPWTARQVWLNLPDRVIGLLDITPNSSATAYEVQGAIRLGFGGTAYSSTKSLTESGTDAWNYGNLTVKLHGHNYANVAPEVYAFRSANAPFTEITLRDQTNGATNTTLKTYDSSTRWKFISEIRPKSTTTDVTVTEIPSPDGLVALEVSGVAESSRYRVIYNPGTAEVVHTPVIGWDGVVRIHTSGSHFRPSWLPEPSAPAPMAILAAGQSVTIAPQAHVVLERVDPPELGANILSPTQPTTTLPTAGLALTLTGSTAPPDGIVPALSWSQTSGPESVLFSNPNQTSTQATFLQPGTYTLRFTATAAGAVSTAERTVIVAPSEGLSPNPLPNVIPGAAPNAIAGTATRMAGATADATSSLWEMISGPGQAAFANSAAPDSDVTFPLAGNYQLRLTASNANGTTSATLAVQVAYASAFAAWQALHWADPGSAAAAPGADPDGDGLANFAEFSAGTDPANAASTAPNHWQEHTASGDYPWSEESHWLYQAAPASSAAAAIHFLQGKSLATGVNVVSRQDLPLPRLANLLVFDGTGASGSRFELTGSALNLASNGTTLPVLRLAALTPLSCRIHTPLVLGANTTIDGNGTARFEVSGSLSGTASLTKSGTSECILSAANSFTGGISHTAGKLTLAHSEALGTTPKTLSMQGTNRVLQLTGGITLPSSLSIVASSNSGDALGIHNLSGNNRILGKIDVSFGNPALNISSSQGTLTISGNLTLITTSRTLYLGGASPEAGVVLGNIGQKTNSDPNSPPYVLSLIKQGIGAWSLDGTCSYTGSTQINAGTLVVNGPMTASSSVGVGASGTLAGRGSIHSPTTIQGRLSPGHTDAGVLTFSKPLTLESSARVVCGIHASSNANAGSDFDQTAAASVTIADGAVLDVVLNPTAGTAVFSDPFWRAPQSWPILTATSLTGELNLGTVSADSSGVPATEAPGRFSLQHDSSGVTLVWTPLSDLERWRLTHFATPENSGSGSDPADPDADGLGNFLEWALDLNPLEASTTPTALDRQPASTTFRYTRRKAATTSGVHFTVEWSDTLGDPWTPAEPGSVVSSSDTAETLEVPIPPSPGGTRFVRVKIH